MNCNKAPQALGHKTLGGESVDRPLVLLKEGSQTPPVFIAPGIGDAALDLLALVGHIEVSNPIYGMQPYGMDGAHEPHRSIAEMADYQLQAIRNLQKDGPYLLVGYSLGGIVTLEIARRLRASGGEVALLMMLDSHIDRHNLPARQRARLAMRLARYRVADLLRGKHGVPHPPGHAAASDASALPATARVKAAQKLALRNYLPKYYPGPVNFIRAAVNRVSPHDPSAVWGELTNGFQLETVPGDHLGMVTTHAAIVGSVLTRHIREALGKR